MSPTRKARGAATERHVANHLANNGWPYATVQRGPGSDIVNIPAWALEVKARRAFTPLAWIRQTIRHAAPNQACIIRPDGMGPEHIGDWLFVMRLDDAIRLMHEAGYGDPPNPVTPSQPHTTESKLHT